ncbi:mannose-6-phosphate receptor binding domain-containing protein [Thamnocephalis sphaerospora]|uniref:Mannose-6-phosphate receptor binding domain-containing protein n=1 Tax=Thamnocephalis sphaerospora TaxID=78915 RepID=A0A4P9XVB1_9FUNG|nr:mannose-6-phosphate receptor binding domain-containing protein [Thamnocephalis sphaerospora]|eukprot:RKP10186.1 mannose-6-phosphate receptor binding domain-containing protein [Thamnocephalis sphaerospora]
MHVAASALLALLVPTLFAQLVSAEDAAPCTVVRKGTSDLYDLRPLIKERGEDWVVKDEDAKTTFRLNVCDEIHYDKTGLKEPWGVAAFQETGDRKGFSIGRVNKTPFFRGDHLLLQYENGDECAQSTERRKTLISFVCDTAVSGQGAPTLVAAMDSCSYWFEWRTPAACVAGTAPIADGGSSSSSGGSTFFTILMVFGSIYLLGGILYKRFVLNASGFEQIPHIDFWRNAIDWIKDMASILIHKVTGSRAPPRTYYSINSENLPSIGSRHSDNRFRGGFHLGDDDDDDDAADVLMRSDTLGREEEGREPESMGQELTVTGRIPSNTSTASGSEGAIRLVDDTDRGH